MQETPTLIVVTTAGTPVQVLPAGPGASSSPVPACKISFENPVGTVGNLYLGKAGMVKSTLVNVIAIIQPGQMRALEDQGGANTIDTTQYWVDHDTSGSKVIVVYNRR